MKELAEKNPTRIIDVLTERLTFERTGVKLYDAVIAKLVNVSDPQIQKMLPELREHRDEEKEHEEWLEAQIRTLGGTAHEMTGRAKLVETESEGIAEIILEGDHDPGQLLHALLTAELADNAGWDLLVQLADEAGDKEAKKAFKKRLHDEEDHLLFVRKAVKKLTVREVLEDELIGGAAESAPVTP